MDVAGLLERIADGAAPKDANVHVLDDGRVEVGLGASEDFYDEIEPYAAIDAAIATLEKKHRKHVAAIEARWGTPTLTTANLADQDVFAPTTFAGELLGRGCVHLAGWKRGKRWAYVGVFHADKELPVILQAGVESWPARRAQRGG